MIKPKATKVPEHRIFPLVTLRQAAFLQQGMWPHFWEHGNRDAEMSKGGRSGPGPAEVL